MRRDQHQRTHGGHVQRRTESRSHADPALEIVIVVLRDVEAAAGGEIERRIVEQDGGGETLLVDRLRIQERLERRACLRLRFGGDVACEVRREAFAGQRPGRCRARQHQLRVAVEVDARIGLRVGGIAVQRAHVAQDRAGARLPSDRPHSARARVRRRARLRVRRDRTAPCRRASATRPTNRRSRRETARDSSDTPRESNPCATSVPATTPRRSAAPSRRRCAVRASCLVRRSARSAASSPSIRRACACSTDCSTRRRNRGRGPSREWSRPRRHGIIDDDPGHVALRIDVEPHAHDIAARTRLSRRDRRA